MVNIQLAEQVVLNHAWIGFEAFFPQFIRKNISGENGREVERHQCNRFMCVFRTCWGLNPNEPNHHSHIHLVSLLKSVQFLVISSGTSAVIFKWQIILSQEHCTWLCFKGSLAREIPCIIFTHMNAARIPRSPVLFALHDKTS